MISARYVQLSWDDEYIYIFNPKKTLQHYVQLYHLNKTAHTCPHVEIRSNSNMTVKVLHDSQSNLQYYLISTTAYTCPLLCNMYFRHYCLLYTLYFWYPPNLKLKTTMSLLFCNLKQVFCPTSEPWIKPKNILGPLVNAVWPSGPRQSQKLKPVLPITFTL